MAEAGRETFEPANDRLERGLPPQSVGLKSRSTFSVISRSPDRGHNPGYAESADFSGGTGTALASSETARPVVGLSPEANRSHEFKALSVR